MSIAEQIRLQISQNVAVMGHEIHREDHFTVQLYAQLWPELGNRILYSTGLYVDQLIPRIRGTFAEAILSERLTNAKDFYADLIVTDPFQKGSRACTLSIADFIESVRVTHLYEFKYLTSFPTLPRKVAREDTYKLQVMGQYVLAVTGQMPHLEQFVVLSNRLAQRVHTVESLQNWFSDAAFRKETQDVSISIVDTHGQIHQGKPSESTSDC